MASALGVSAAPAPSRKRTPSTLPASTAQPSAVFLSWKYMFERIEISSRAPPSTSARSTSRWGFDAASISAVMPVTLPKSVRATTSGSAPKLRRMRTTSAWPVCDAKSIAEAPLL